MGDLLIGEGLGYLREHPNPNAIAHPTDGGLRYHGRPPRERPGHSPKGILTAHSTEGLHDTVPPDLGAESTARYLATTRRSASYHFLCDSDSAIELLPPAWRAWHVARDDSNRLRNSWANTHTYGWAYGGQAARWNDDPTWAQAVIAQAAPVLHAYREWCRITRGIYVPLRTVSTGDIARGARGFTEHGSWQRDRYDPGWSGTAAVNISYTPGGQSWRDLFDLLRDYERHEEERAPEVIDIVSKLAGRFIQFKDPQTEELEGGLWWAQWGYGLEHVGRVSGVDVSTRWPGAEPPSHVWLLAKYFGFADPDTDDDAVTVVGSDLRHVIDMHVEAFITAPAPAHD